METVVEKPAIFMLRLSVHHVSLAVITRA